jgi:hypothetical protein
MNIQICLMAKMAGMVTAIQRQMSRFVWKISSLTRLIDKVQLINCSVGVSTRRMDLFDLKFYCNFRRILSVAVSNRRRLMVTGLVFPHGRWMK